MNFREVVEKLKKAKKLKVVNQKLSTKFEISDFARENKEALLFKIKNSDYKIAANICTYENMQILYNLNRKQLLEKMLYAIENSIKPKVSEEHNFIEEKPDFSKLPILTHYKNDGSAYITAGVFFAEHKELGRNLSFHRIMLTGKNTGTVRICHRHLWEFYNRANKNLDVAVCIGLDPALLLAGATCVSLGYDETEIAGAFNGKPIELVKLENWVFPKDAEIVLLGKLLPQEEDEGPFVDMTGTIDFVRKQPVLKVEKILHQKNPIYHAIISAGEEHRFLMGFPREPVIFKEVSKVCKCVDVTLTSGGISWLHCVVSIEKNSDEAPKKVIEAVFKAHPSVKHVFVVDSDINIHNFEEVEWVLATRFQGDKQLHVYPNARGSSLDPSAKGFEDRRITCKLGFDCTIPNGKEKKDFLKAE